MVISIATILAVKIPDQLDPEHYDFFMSKVSPSRRHQVQKYVRRGDAYRSLLGEVLTRAVICTSLRYSNDNIQFQKNEYGKPRLADHEEFSFNVSHSGEFVVLIFGQGLLGIDIEEVKPMDLAIAASFFSGEEQQQLMSREEEQRLDYFYDLWTLKESFIKAVGTGLTRPLNSFTIREELSGEVVLTPEDEKFYFKKYETQKPYKLSACCSKNQLPQTIYGLEAADLYAWLRE